MTTSRPVTHSPAASCPSCALKATIARFHAQAKAFESGAAAGGEEEAADDDGEMKAGEANGYGVVAVDLAEEAKKAAEMRAKVSSAPAGRPTAMTASCLLISCPRRASTPTEPHTCTFQGKMLLHLSQ